MELNGRCVLLLSQDLAGGVRFFSSRLRNRDLQVILVSNVPNDPNAQFCDQCVFFDWAHASRKALSSLLGALPERPIHVVNAVEPLLHWQAELNDLLELQHPAQDAIRTLQSKLQLRQLLRDHGLSNLPFYGATAEKFDPSRVAFFPCVLKPSRDSGRSKDVRICADVTELRSRVQAVIAQGSGGKELICEGYLPGIEFSLDGYVQRGVFHPLYWAEKLDYNYDANQDGGSLLSPPVSIDAAVAEKFTHYLQRICQAGQLDSVWMHIEGRVAEERAEIIEINPRIGGGEYANAVKLRSGLDPFEVILSLFLGEGSVDHARVSRGYDGLMKQIIFHADRLGRLTDFTPLKTMLSLTGVVSGHVIRDFEATNLEQENLFAQFLIKGGTLEELTQLETEVRQRFTFRFTSSS